MAFNQQKGAALNNLLAAEKVGDLDLELKSLLEIINRHSDYYTTSSCGGRVVLMQAIGGKGINKFLAKWHSKVSSIQVMESLRSCDGIVWFRFESPILHVVARTQEKAARLLHICHESGFKRSGIHSLKDERILLEVLSTERVDAPVMVNGEKIASDDYLNLLVEQANMKYDLCAVKLKRLQENMSRLG